MPYTPEATPLRKLPQIWKLAGVTYGLVIVATIVTVAAYRHYGHGVDAQESELERKSARISVGDLWLPMYPDGIVQELTSTTNNGVVQGDLRFTSVDAPDKLVAFYRTRLRSQFKVDYSRTPTGGRMEAVAFRGRSSATLIFNVSGSGCDTMVHTETDEKKR